MGLFNRKNGRNAEVENKQDQQGSVKSAGSAPFVEYILGSSLGSGVSLSPSTAFWLWQVSDTIGSACDKISWAFELVDPVLKDKKTGEFLTRPDDHPFLGLLANPGFKQDSSQFKFELMTSFLVAGESFPVLDGNVNYEPIQMYNVPADKANLVPDVNNDLYSIRFTDDSTQRSFQRQMIPKRKIYVYQTSDKLSETIRVMIKKRRTGVQAQSVLDRVYYQALTKYYGNMHNSGLVKNGSRPSGMFSPDGPLNQDQYEAWKNEIREQLSGPQNAGKPLVPPRPMDYKELGLNPKDMDFVKLIEQSRNEIYNIYDIPLPLVSERTMTMSNFENSMIAFFDNAVLPRAKFVFKRLGEFALPRYKDGDRFELTYDEKSIPAMQARLLDRGKKMREIYSFAEDEIRTVVGYESLGPEGKFIYKPATLMPSGEDDDYTSDNRRIGNDDMEDDDIEEIEDEENEGTGEE